MIEFLLCIYVQFKIKFNKNIQSDFPNRNFTVHRCKFKKCYMCFNYRKKTQYGNIFCANAIEKIFQCGKCKKKTYDPDCFQRHKMLSSYDCQIIKVCQSCGTSFRGRDVDHFCNILRCQICFTFHTKNYA